jgi:hypothetical protein
MTFLVLSVVLVQQCKWSKQQDCTHMLWLLSTIIDYIRNLWSVKTTMVVWAAEPIENDVPNTLL